MKKILLIVLPMLAILAATVLANGGVTIVQWWGSGGSISKSPIEIINPMISFGSNVVDTGGPDSLYGSVSLTIKGKMNVEYDLGFTTITIQKPVVLKAYMKKIDSCTLTPSLVQCEGSGKLSASQPMNVDIVFTISEGESPHIGDFVAHQETEEGPVGVLHVENIQVEQFSFKIV